MRRRAHSTKMEQTTHHTVEAFDAELEELRRRTLSMAETVKSQLQAVGEALAAADEKRAQAVAEGDEAVNAWELSLDAYVEFLLSRRQPQASDLRLLIGALRESVDLERAGDEIRSAAKGIVHQHGQLSQEAERIWPSLVKMHALAMSMMEDALAILNKPDVSPAYALIGRRSVVRTEMKALMEAVLEAISANRITPESGFEMMRIARAFERVSAHLQNVGEAVVFVVDGVDVRHEHDLK